ncbi:MAG: hypothetical protein V4613_09180 [Bacteroidota bacterium]
MTHRFTILVYLFFQLGLLQSQSLNESIPSYMSRNGYHLLTMIDSATNQIFAKYRIQKNIVEQEFFQNGPDKHYRKIIINSSNHDTILDSTKKYCIRNERMRNFLKSTEIRGKTTTINYTDSLLKYTLITGPTTKDTLYFTWEKLQNKKITRGYYQADKLTYDTHHDRYYKLPTILQIIEFDKLNRITRNKLSFNSKKGRADFLNYQYTYNSSGELTVSTLTTLNDNRTRIDTIKHYNLMINDGILEFDTLINGQSNSFSNLMLLLDSGSMPNNLNSNTIRFYKNDIFESDQYSPLTVDLEKIQPSFQLGFIEFNYYDFRHLNGLRKHRKHYGILIRRINDTQYYYNSQTSAYIGRIQDKQLIQNGYKIKGELLKFDKAIFLSSDDIKLTEVINRSKVVGTFSDSLTLNQTKISRFYNEQNVNQNSYWSNLPHQTLLYDSIYHTSKKYFTTSFSIKTSSNNEFYNHKRIYNTGNYAYQNLLLTEYSKNHRLIYQKIAQGPNLRCEYKDSLNYYVMKDVLFYTSTYAIFQRAGFHLTNASRNAISLNYPVYFETISYSNDTVKRMNGFSATADNYLTFIHSHYFLTDVIALRYGINESLFNIRYQNSTPIFITLKNSYLMKEQGQMFTYIMGCMNPTLTLKLNFTK